MGRDPEKSPPQKQRLMQLVGKPEEGWKSSAPQEQEFVELEGTYDGAGNAGMKFRHRSQI